MVLLEGPKIAQTHITYLTICKYGSPLPHAVQTVQFILLAADDDQCCQLASSRRNTVDDRARGQLKGHRGNKDISP
jgi:hypothetical protein